MAGTNRLLFRRVHAEDGPEILRLYNTTLGRNRTLREWQWECLEGPVGPFLGWATEVKDRLVAHWAVIPLLGLSQGREFILGKGELAVTDPSYQGRAIFPRLLRTAIGDLERSSVEATWSFPNNTLWRVQEWIGFQMKTPIKYLMSLRRPSRVLRALADARLIELASSLLSPFDGVSARLVSPRNRIDRSIEVAELDDLDDRFEALWRRVELSEETTLVRNQSFLRWRFAQNPRIKYMFFLATDSGGDPLGYAIVMDRLRGKLRLGEVVDLFIEPSRREIAEALLDAARHHFDKKDVDAIRFFASSRGTLSQTVTSAAKRCGFTIAIKGSTLSVRNTGIQNNPIMDENWYVTASFTEGINY